MSTPLNSAVATDTIILGGGKRLQETHFSSLDRRALFIPRDTGLHTVCQPVRWYCGLLRLPHARSQQERAKFSGSGGFSIWAVEDLQCGEAAKGVWATTSWRWSGDRRRRPCR